MGTTCLSTVDMGTFSFLFSQKIKKICCKNPTQNSTYNTFNIMATIISALPLNPTPFDPRTSKSKMITTTMRKTPTTTPPPSPHPAPSPPTQPPPAPPPPENQNALTATLFASRPFDLVQGSQVQIGWNSAGPLYSVSIRLVRQNPAPAKIIETWPDVLPGISTVTVAMPSNNNVNQVQPSPSISARSDVKKRQVY